MAKQITLYYKVPLYHSLTSPMMDTIYFDDGSVLLKAQRSECSQQKFLAIARQAFHDRVHNEDMRQEDGNWVMDLVPVVEPETAN